MILQGKQSAGQPNSRKRRWILAAIAGLLSVCPALLCLIALTNLDLPTRSPATTGTLSPLQHARLAEAIQLRATFGSQVWQDWGAQEIPILVYDETYAYLVNYPGDPPPGWLKMPQKIARGGAWQVTPGDTFADRVYYRQPLPDPEITPENFTVLVGDRWVATLATREHAEIDFYADLQAQTFPLFRPFLPYRLIWNLLMGDTEAYIGALEHEAFHAFQGTRAPARLEAAERAVRYEQEYPWDDPALDAAWKKETDLLVRAVRTPSDTEAQALARQFLEQRAARRVSAGLNANLVDYERQREWLEGLAKYAELTLGKAASDAPGYAPVAALGADPDFHNYRSGQELWSRQLDEALRTEGRSGETRFYYSGMAQAVLLDRLLPGWKVGAFDAQVFLEDLVRQAVARP
jgi:hypothetical protein